jgi:hypothetical protein
MKIRLSFVSNSSSSSFIISKRNLSNSQIRDIFNHSSVAEQINLREGKTVFDNTECSWSVYDNEDEIKLFTDMDNFDMEEFLEYIGVSESNLIKGY